jgi:hypothetical protein
VIIRVERSGGFAGISSYAEVKADKLPPSLEGTVRHLLTTSKVPPQNALGRPKGAADHFTYKIMISDGKKDHVINCNEYEMNANLRSLIRYVQENSKK